MRTRRRWMPWPAILLILGVAGEVAACPNCKEAVANQDGSDAKRLADGYSYSILFMMAMPFTLLGTGAFLVARAVKRGGLPEL
jgi:hypothetical protein